MEFAAWLKAQKAESVDQSDIASRLGKTQGYISQLATGKRHPTDEMVAKIAEISDGQVTAADWPRKADSTSGLPINPGLVTLRTQRVPLDQIESDEDDLDEGVVASIAQSYEENHVQVARLLAIYDKDRDRYVIQGGKHRVAAAKRAGVKALDVAVLPYETEEEKVDAELICISENLDRRVLSASRLGQLHARRKELYLQKHPDAAEGRGGDRKSTDTMSVDRSYATDAAEKSGVSERHVRRFTRIGEELAPEIHDKVRGTKLDEVKELSALASIPESKRDEVVEKALTGEGPKPSIALKQQDYKARQAIVAGRQKEIEGRYGVVYVDPPTEFRTWSQDGKAKGPETAFSTMTMEQIAELPVGDLAQDDAMLFYWTTGLLMEEAMRLCRMWGFDYASRITWVKETKAGEMSEDAKLSRGTGYRFIETSETLLVYYRGNVIWPAAGLQWRDVIYAPRSGKYSRKPDEIYDMIDTYAGPLSKLELFQRDLEGKGARPGWTVWGNESSETPSDPEPGTATHGENVVGAGAEAISAAATVASAPPIGGDAPAGWGNSEQQAADAHHAAAKAAEPPPSVDWSRHFDLGEPIAKPAVPDLPQGA